MWSRIGLSHMMKCRFPPLPPIDIHSERVSLRSEVKTVRWLPSEAGPTHAALLTLPQDDLVLQVRSVVVAASQ